MSIKDHLIKLTMFDKGPKNFEMTGQWGRPPPLPPASPSVLPLVTVPIGNTGYSTNWKPIGKINDTPKYYAFKTARPII